MAPLRAAGLREQVREAMLSSGLRGFVRIGTEGKPLLLTDALRRGTAEEKAVFLAVLDRMGLKVFQAEGLLWAEPSDRLLQRMIGEAEPLTAGFAVRDWRGGMTEAESLAVRFLREKVSESWTKEGRMLLLEALRLPDPSLTGWPEADRLRPAAAELLRRHDRTALHGVGVILAFRLLTKEQNMEHSREQESISVRPAGEQDIAAIERLYDKIHDEEDAGRLKIGWERGVYPVRATAEAALGRGDLFVMEQNGQLAAAAIINHLQPDGYDRGPWQFPAAPEQVMVLHTLTVDPAFAGHGLGTRFVAFYEDYSLKHGCPFLRMDTNANNRSARKLYAKLGYREIAVVPTVFNGIAGVNLVLLEKKLG